MARRAVETVYYCQVFTLWTTLDDTGLRNNGNNARFLQVSPFHSPNTLLISAHPLSSRHRRRWARPLAVSYDWQTVAILLPPPAAYHVNTKVGFFFRLRPERWLHNYQNCLASCTSRRRLFPQVRHDTRRHHALQIAVSSLTCC